MTSLYPIGGVNRETKMIKDIAVSLNTDGNTKGKRSISWYYYYYYYLYNIVILTMSTEKLKLKLNEM
jgi:hypothetical protein